MLGLLIPAKLFHGTCLTFHLKKKVNNISPRYLKFGGYIFVVYGCTKKGIYYRAVTLWNLFWYLYWSIYHTLWQPLQNGKMLYFVSAQHWSKGSLRKTTIPTKLCNTSNFKKNHTKICFILKKLHLLNKIKILNKNQLGLFFCFSEVQYSIIL